MIIGVERAPEKGGRVAQSTWAEVSTSEQRMGLSFTAAKRKKRCVGTQVDCEQKRERALKMLFDPWVRCVAKRSV